MTGFTKDYFSTYYGNYFTQNPPRKLQGYLTRIRRHKTGGRLLDIGCSFGVFVEAAKAWFCCTGMDVDPEVVSMASARVPGATFVAASLPGLPFQRLDVITALDVLEHLADPDSAVAAIGESLSPGGIALIVIPVYDGPLGWLVHLLDKDPTHLQKRSRSYWLELVSRHMEIREWGGIFRKLILGRFFVNFMTDSLRRISPAIFIIVGRSEMGKGAENDCDCSSCVQ